MHKLLIFGIIGLLIGCSGMPDTPTQADLSSNTDGGSFLPTVSIVPLPAELQPIEGELYIHTGVNITFADQAPYSRSAIIQTFEQLDIPKVSSGISVSLSLDPTLELGKEGYRLVIDDAIKLSAQTDIGLFYAVQTLRQLLPASHTDSLALPKLSIRDQPRYSYRGSMLDPARRYIPMEYIKAHVERMALFKLNRLHLHLTDDQGWRIEIKAYPKLTEIGGSTQVDGGGGGWYTQEELRDLVSFAKARGVEIVPEIDMPGHTQAAIASYPELACPDYGNYELYEGKKVGFSYFCLREPDRVYPFVETMLKEVTDIFPYEYIHIGGDEIENPRYGEFITRADAIVAKLGRKTIAWEEASKGSARSNALLQLWNDEYDIQPAIDRGHQLIASPCSYVYLDHGNYSGQPNTYTWCRESGLPLERVYALNPDLFPAVMGVEAPIWGEEIRSNADWDDRAWPRSAAVAEVAWSPQNNRNYTNFITRMKQLRSHLDVLNVYYFKEPDLGWDRSIGSINDQRLQ